MASSPVLTREAWKNQRGLVLVENDTGGEPLQRTEVRVGWDVHALWVLFVAEDSRPWATLMGRDQPLYTEEVFEVFLDPFGDGAAYFELEVNPNNAVLDVAMRRIRSGYRKDFSWRCEGLQTAAALIPGGWAAELRIPFESVVCERPRAGDEWRVNFTRIDRPENGPRELSAWSPTGMAQFHLPERFGRLRFEGAGDIGRS